MEVGQAEGLAGFSDKAIYYGYFLQFSKKPIGIASIQVYRNKIKFNNAYVDPSSRRKGIYKRLFEHRLEVSRSLGATLIEATCTKSSVRFWIKRGAVIVRAYKNYTKVHLYI